MVECRLKDRLQIPAAIMVVCRIEDLAFFSETSHHLSLEIQAHLKALEEDRHFRHTFQVNVDPSFRIKVRRSFLVRALRSRRQDRLVIRSAGCLPQPSLPTALQGQATKLGFGL